MVGTVGRDSSVGIAIRYELDDLDLILGIKVMTPQ